jgi:type I restriction enzyme S subunit
MEVKPGYKRTDLGILPEDWEVLPFKEQFNISAGGDVNLKLSSAEQDEIHRFPIYSNALTDQGLYGYCSYADHPAQSITITARGTLGVATYRDHRYTAIGRVLVLEPKRQTAGQFFAEFINNRVKFAIESTGVPQLTAPQISGYRLAVPPYPEQRAIAAALIDVDAVLGAVERLIAKKRDLKQAAMQQLLTGQTRLPGFHGEWEVKMFGELFDFSGGYSASRDQLFTEGHCYLHYGDIHGSSKTFVDTRVDYQDIPKLEIPLKQISCKSLLKDGDVVFVDASEDDEGTSRHVVVVNKDNVPFISGLHTIVAKSKTDELAHEYRRYCFQTPAIRQQFLFYAVGTKVSGISKTNIAKLTLPVPKVAEQAAIAAVLTDVDAELAALEQRLAKTRALKQGMMQELLTGKTRLVSPEVSHA